MFYGPQSLFSRKAGRSFVGCLFVLAFMVGSSLALAGDGTLQALLPDSPGFFKLQLQTTAAGKSIDLPFRLFIPKTYDTTQDRFGLLIYLPDNDARGSDLSAVINSGPEKLLRADANFALNFRILVVTPQIPANSSWDAPETSAAILQMIRRVSTGFRIDPDRVVITGGGAGATAALKIAAASPATFAGVVANSASFVDVKSNLALIRHVGLYLSAAQNDPDTLGPYRQMAETLGNGGASNLSVKQVGTNREESIRQFFADPNTYAWIAKQKRLSAAEALAADQQQAKKISDEIARLPNTPGDYKLAFETWVGDQKMAQPYMISLPVGYDKTKAPWPMLVFLHGLGEAEPGLNGCYKHGPLCFGQHNPAFRQWLPMIVMLPYHDNSLDRAQAIVNTIHDVLPKFRIDADRIYCTGFSYGARTTWNLTIADPSIFAAIAPISGRVAQAEIVGQRAKDVPSWMIVGSTDGPFFEGSTQMNASLTKANADLHYTVIPGEGHASWTRYFEDERFYYWFLEHRRTPGTAQPVRERPVGTAATVPGQYRLTFNTQVDGKPVALRYALYLPKGYGTGSTRWPLMLSLHADADKNTDLGLIFQWGTDVDPRRDPAALNSFPMIGLAPQLPADRNWTDPQTRQLLLALLDHVSNTYPVDEDRIYGIGQATGGNGLMQLAEENPHRFAAIAPLLAAAVTTDTDTAKLRGVPVRMLERADQNFTMAFARQTADSIRRTSGEVRLTRLEPSAPDRWKPFYTEPGFCAWLLAHHRLSPDQFKSIDDAATRMAAAPIPQTSGTYPLHFDTVIDGSPFALDYRLYLPKQYDKGNDRIPLMLFINDPVAAPSTQPVWGPDVVLGTDPKLADSVAMIALCPRLPAGRKWNDPVLSKALVALVDQVSTRCRVDTDRVYAGGVGGGSAGAISAVAEAPDRFAGIACAVPPAPSIAGERSLSDIIPQLPPIGFCLMSTPAQTAATNALADVLRKEHADVQVTQLPDATDTAQRQPFAGPQLFQWLTTHRRRE